MLANNRELCLERDHMAPKRPLSGAALLSHQRKQQHLNAEAQVSILVIVDAFLSDQYMLD